jgi:hypothetical protein
MACHSARPTWSTLFKRTGRACLLIYLLLLNVLSSAQGETIKEVRVYSWALGAYSNDETGRFNHCYAAYGPYRSGIYLLFAIDKSFDWAMVLANPAWQLTPGAQYKIQYQIDNDPPLNALAIAESNILAQVDLPDSESLFRRFQRGWRLKVRAEGDEFILALDNSSKVLAAAVECTKAFIALERDNTNPNPFASKTPQMDGDAAKTSQLAPRQWP